MRRRSRMRCCSCCYRRSGFCAGAGDCGEGYGELMARLGQAVGAKASLWKRIKDVALTDVGVLVRGLDHGSLEQIEELLLTADFGVPATLKLVDHIEGLSRGG